MVPKLPSELPKDRQAKMLATVKIESASASCPSAMDQRLPSPGNTPDEQSTLPELSYFNVDDFLNTIDRLNDNLSDSNGGLNGEQFMNLAEVSEVCPLRETCLPGFQSQGTNYTLCKIEPEDPQDMDDTKGVDTDRNSEAAVPTAGEASQNARRKRSFDLSDPTLASMFYPGNACLEPLAKKVRIVESGSSAYLEWFSSTDTSVQHLAASDMLEVLKLPKDNAFASWVAFNTEKSTDKKEDCAEEVSVARLAGYDFDASPRSSCEESDYDMYWMSNSDDYLSSAPSGKSGLVLRGVVRQLDYQFDRELMSAIELVAMTTMMTSSEIKNRALLLEIFPEKQTADWVGDELEEGVMEDMVRFIVDELVEDEDLEVLQLDVLEEVLGNEIVPPGEFFGLIPEDWEQDPEDAFLSLDESQKSNKKQLQPEYSELPGYDAGNCRQSLENSSGCTKKTQAPSGRPRGRPKKVQASSGSQGGVPKKAPGPSGRPRGRPRKAQGPASKLRGRKPKNGGQCLEDEIDVVSVPTACHSPSAESPAVEDHLSSWDILPASTLMSEHIADLHSYSSRPAHLAPAPDRCPVMSVSAPPSPVHRVAPPPAAKRCISNPASPIQRVAARHRKRRGMQEGRGRRTKIDKDCMKRAQHNVLERERRLQLTQQFTVLRVQVPSIRSNERASKSDILNGARSYILKLRHQRTELKDTYEKETRVNAQLRKTLNEAIKMHKSSSKRGVV